MAFERTEGSRPARPMRRGRKKVCSFCVDRIDTIDYKDVPRLRKPFERCLQGLAFVGVIVDDCDPHGVHASSLRRIPL